MVAGAAALQAGPTMFCSAAGPVRCCEQDALDLLWAAAQGGLLQCGCILLAGLLLWAFRTSSDSDGYGAIY